MGSTSEKVWRIVGWSLVGLLFVRFLFELSLTATLTIAPLLVFALAAALALPPVGRALAQWPLVGRGLGRGIVIAALLLVATAWLASGNRISFEPVATAYRGATILTGVRDAPAIENGTVLVDASGRITAVGASDAVEIPSGVEVVDLTGRFLMPGLVNAHAHLMMQGVKPGEPSRMTGIMTSPALQSLALAFMDSAVGQRIILRMMERNVEHALRSGVTTLRGVGDPGWIDVALRKRVEQGVVIGPRLRVSGPLLATTGGHAHQIGSVVDGPVEARRAVREAFHHEVDHIKIASTGGVSDARRLGEAGELQMTPDEIAAVTDEAHRKNYLVTAHAESTQGVLEALRAGVDNIEHGAELDDEAIALFLDNPNSLRGFTSLHPTLSVISTAGEVTDEVRADPRLYVITANGQRIKEAMLKGFRQAVEGGVRIGVGTDAGIVDHGSVWMEMQYFVEHGDVTPELALHWGTLGTAESIGLQDETGSIEPGKSADLLVLEGDPRRDLATLARPVLVVARGVPVEPASEDAR